MSIITSQAGPDNGYVTQGRPPAERVGTLRVATALCSEMSQRGLTSMLAVVESVAEVFPVNNARELHLAVESGRFDVLITSCIDSPTSHQDLRVVSAAGIKIALLLSSVDRQIVARAVDLPSDGFLLEGSLTVGALRDGLSLLSRGEMPMPASLTRELFAVLKNKGADDSDRSLRLTPREQQSLALLVEGLSNKQIARRLGVSEHGAKRHVANVLAKLNCPNRTLAVAEALRKDLLGT